MKLLSQINRILSWPLRVFHLECRSPPEIKIEILHTMWTEYLKFCGKTHPLYNSGGSHPAFIKEYFGCDGEYKVIHGDPYLVFSFKNSDEAMLFKLKWL